MENSFTCCDFLQVATRIQGRLQQLAVWVEIELIHKTKIGLASEKPVDDAVIFLRIVNEASTFIAENFTQNVN